jgi:hypothetical protein
MVAASDGERSRFYMGTPGGTVPVVGLAGVLHGPIPGLDSLLDGGVGRYASKPLGMYRVHLPVVLGNELPSHSTSLLLVGPSLPAG